MEGILNLLPLYAEDPYGELNLGLFLETCRIHQSFNDQKDDDSKIQAEHDHALGIIHAKLNDADKRIEGALLLDVLVPQCRTETFTTHCVSWVQQVMKLFQGPTKLEGGAAACSVLEKLLAFSSQFPEISRQLSTTVITSLVGFLCDAELSRNGLLSLNLLSCLKSCMRYYNTSCGPVKAAIERHLLSMADWEDISPQSSLQISWAECLALLPSLGGSGPQGAQHKTNWIEFCSQIIHSIHGSINGLYRNIEEIKTYEVSAVSSLKLIELCHPNPMVLLLMERRRFMNLCSALSVLLKEPFPTSKNIPVDQILELISRLLSLNSRTLSKSSRANFEQLTLGSMIPELHASVLDVLTALIGVCRGQLVTRAGNVMNLHVQILQWTFTPYSQRHVAAERPFGKLREQVYRSLCSWLAASRSACGLTKYSDVLLSQLLSDVVVHRDVVQLLAVNQSSSNDGGQVSKKGKKKLLDQPGVILNKMDQRSNADVSQAALHCLSTLLLYCGSRIKPSIHKEIQEVVISILIEIMNGAQLKTLLPYNEAGCRAGLYRVLEKLVLCPSAHWPAPINYASTLFNSGLNDPSLEVTAICAQGLVSMQSILRPRGPTLSFALEGKQMRFVQQEAPLVSSNGHGLAVEVTPSADTPPIDVTIAIRQPEISPAVFKPPAPPTEGVFSTPPEGVTSVFQEAPTDPIMTRHEAVKLIAVTETMKSPSLVCQPSDATARKRPPPVQTETAPPEKILKELPYGADTLEDDVEAMLASFRDVPVE